MEYDSSVAVAYAEVTSAWLEVRCASERACVHYEPLVSVLLPIL